MPIRISIDTNISMPSTPPSMMLKIVWMVHFVLSSWAQMSGFIGISTYWYTHVGALAFGFWAMVQETSIDAIFMFVVTLAISSFNDILCIAIYEPRAHDAIEHDSTSASQKNEYRFALGMAITNLIIKPVTVFLMYRVYQSRANGSDFNYGIPEGIPGIELPIILHSGRTSGHGGYSNIEDSNANSNSKVRSPSYQEPPPSAYQSSPSAPHDVNDQGQSEA